MNVAVVFLIKIAKHLLDMPRLIRESKKQNQVDQNVPNYLTLCTLGGFSSPTRLYMAGFDFVFVFVFVIVFLTQLSLYSWWFHQPDQIVGDQVRFLQTSSS